MSLLHRLFIAVAVALALAAAPSAQQPAQGADKAAAGAAGEPTLNDDHSAVEASKTWLSQIDAGKTGERWNEASKHLKSTVTRKKWVNGLRGIRKPYGTLKSRQPARFARAHSLPDSPDGDYVIVEFDSDFNNGKHAVERVVWMLESDGVWRVSGYFIR